MNVFFQKLSELHREFAEDHGPFVLFGLFMTEDTAPVRWILVISAPWLPEDDLEAARPFFRRLQDKLWSSEIVQISYVLIREPTNPLIRSLRGISFRGRGLELAAGHGVYGPGVQLVNGTDYAGGIVVIGADWVELPASIFSGIQFERVVLFYSNPELAVGTQAATETALAG